MFLIFSIFIILIYPIFRFLLIRSLNSMGPPTLTLTDFHIFFLILYTCNHLLKSCNKKIKWARPMGPIFGSHFPSKFCSTTTPVHKNGLPEIICRFRGFLGFPVNGPNRAGPALGSTRARGKGDSSLHKLLQMSSNSTTSDKYDQKRVAA